MLHPNSIGFIREIPDRSALELIVTLTPMATVVTPALSHFAREVRR
jgi:hypothetical protein